MELYSSRKNLVQIAKLYYSAGMSQQQISATMGISRSKVSRMLSLAREMRVVQFQICEYPNLQSELEHKLKEHFGLETVVVAPSAATLDGSKKNVGIAAARLLRSRLKEDMIIGIEWGSTSDQMVEAYEQHDPLPGVEVMQITGGMHISDTISDGRELVKKLAHKMGAEYSLLQYPMVVHSAVLASMIMENECADYFQKLSTMDIAVVGMGSSLPHESSTYLGGYITQKEAHEMAKSGYAADICGHRLTQDGKPAETILNGRMITLSLEQLKKIPSVVAIAAGERKVESIIATAKGGYITSLVADEVAAIAIAGKEKLI